MWPMCSDSSGLTPNGTACCPETLQREVSLTSETTASTNSQVSRSETPVGKNRVSEGGFPVSKCPVSGSYLFQGSLEIHGSHSETTTVQPLEVLHSDGPGGAQVQLHIMRYLRGPRSRSATGAVGRPTAPGWGSPHVLERVALECRSVRWRPRRRRRFSKSPVPRQAPT